MTVGGNAAREARTHFTLERELEGFSLLRLRLETGRTHQVRVHMQAIGHPVCGDPEYGGRGVLGLRRQFLHSARLSFTHPITGVAIDVSSPLPPDLRAALALAEGPATATMPAHSVIVNAYPFAPKLRPCPAREPGPPLTRVALKPSQSRQQRESVEHVPLVQAAAMAEVGIAELLEAGVHFGHQTRRWNPKMRRFLFGERNGIYIIDLLQTQALLKRAQDFAEELARRGGMVLFVGTKKQARDVIEEVAAGSRHALRQPPLAGRPAHQLPNDLAAHQVACTNSSATSARDNSACCPRRSGCPRKPTLRSCARTSGA